jgi:hypothetical protein
MRAAHDRTRPGCEIVRPMSTRELLELRRMDDLITLIAPHRAVDDERKRSLAAV